MSGGDTASAIVARTGGGRESRDTVSAKLNSLDATTYDTLRAEWRRLYRQAPPKGVSRDLLVLGIAWKIQEQTYGGLSAATKRRLAQWAKDLDRVGDIKRSRIERLRPGARLVREWQGESHRVIVVEDGFEWRGTRWRSSSAIAREITGTHWSGPRFFGLDTTSPAEITAQGLADG